MHDFVPSPNIRRHPEIYELENHALARDGRLQAALRAVAPWRDRRVLSVGCGTGFWLPRYAGARVVGIEPDRALLARAAARIAHAPQIEVRHGSAEHLPIADASVDLVHARWAYFFGAGAEAGLAEARRVLRPGGVFVAVDNRAAPSDFAALLADAVGGNADHDLDATAVDELIELHEHVAVSAGRVAESPAQLARILRIEFPADTVERFLQAHTGASISYAMSLFVVRA